MSDEQVATAVKAALTAADAHPYEIDAVPANATDYTELGVTRRFGGNPRSTYRSGVVGYRVTTRTVGLTVANAREIRSRQHTALEAVRLTVGSGLTSPVVFEGAEDIRPDDGYFTGLTTWTFSL